MFVHNHNKPMPKSKPELFAPVENRFGDRFIQASEMVDGDKTLEKIVEEIDVPKAIQQKCIQFSTEVKRLSKSEILVLYGKVLNGEVIHQPQNQYAVRLEEIEGLLEEGKPEEAVVSLTMLNENRPSIVSKDVFDSIIETLSKAVIEKLPTDSKQMVDVVFENGEEKYKQLDDLMIAIASAKDEEGNIFYVNSLLCGLIAQSNPAIETEAFAQLLDSQLNELPEDVLEEINRRRGNPEGLEQTQLYEELADYLTDLWLA